MEGGDDKNGFKNKFSIIEYFCSLLIHYFDVNSEDLYMPRNVMAHFNKYMMQEVAICETGLTLFEEAKKILV